MRYIIRLSYNGSSFCGWQLQKNAPSIQEELQHALSTVFQEKVRITGAGRTDTGVNAINYIAHFDLPDGCAFNTEKALYKLNAILPGTIAIHSLSQADEGLHARFSAISREYHYFVHRNKDPFIGNYSYYCRYPIDMEKMNEAAALLKGTRDFSCFEKTGGNNATSICTVYDAGWHIYSPAHVSLLGYPSEDGDYIVFRIRADRFLRNMPFVR